MTHYFTEKPEKPLKLKLIEDVVRGVKIKLYTSSEVFSKDKIDEGTRLLIESMLLLDGWEVLDLGCGYGVIGIVVKKLCPTCKVYMVDINPKAVELAKLNCKLNNVECIILQGDTYEPVKDKKFDTIITNPPYSAGKEIVFKFIDEAIEHLKKNGIFQMVVPKKFKSLYYRKLKTTFKEVFLIGKNSRYNVYVCKP